MPAEAPPAHLDRCVVLPLQPISCYTYDGVGLALHFLLGNIMALHSKMQELWFGWRVSKLFDDCSHLSAYCRGLCQTVDLNGLSRKERIRYWVHGQYDHQGAAVTLFDAHCRQEWRTTAISFNGSLHLVEFRQSFLWLFHQMGLPFPESQERAALWEEKISFTGLKSVGRALELFYCNTGFNLEDRMDLAPFEKAVLQAPESFIAYDLMGWAYYHHHNYSKAAAAFQHALTINPDGVGAMSGLMWCGVQMKDSKQACYWAIRKAEICKQDVNRAKERALRLYRKYL